MKDHLIIFGSIYGSYIIGFVVGKNELAWWTTLLMVAVGVIGFFIARRYSNWP